MSASLNQGLCVPFIVIKLITQAASTNAFQRKGKPKGGGTVVKMEKDKESILEGLQARRSLASFDKASSKRIQQRA